MKPDKKKYTLVCLIGGSVISIGLMFFMYYPNAIVIGNLIMLAGAIAYEFYQLKTGKGQFEVLDMVADLFGCVISFLILNFIIFAYLLIKIL